MSAHPAVPTKRHRENKTYLMTRAMHRLELALSDDPESSEYLLHIESRLAHILGKLDGVWPAERQSVIDKTRKCIEDNSPNETVKSHFLEKLDNSQAA